MILSPFIAIGNKTPAAMTVADTTDHQKKVLYSLDDAVLMVVAIGNVAAMTAVP